MVYNAITYQWLLSIAYQRRTVDMAAVFMVLVRNGLAYCL